MEKLTFTRFIAAMTVVLTHFGYGMPVIDEIPWSLLLRQGQFMVSYFFVLSGFIMAAVYWDLEGRGERGAYWVARFARIYPVYLLGLVFMVALGSPEVGPQPGRAVALHVLMIQAWLPKFAVTGNPPGWSLSAEAFFYLLFPFCLPLLRRSRGVWRPVLAVALIWAATQVGYHIGRQSLEVHFSAALHNALHYDPLLHLNAFLIGVVAQLVMRRRGWGAASPRSSSLLPFTLAVISAAVIAATFIELGRGVYVAGAFVSATNGLLAPVFALFIAALSADASPATRWLAWWPLVALGEMSYAVYMLQDPMRELVYRIGTLPGIALEPGALFATFLLALMVVSALVWRFYEVPLRRSIRVWLGTTPRPHGGRPAMV